jgi:hypothetical protein
MPCKLILSTAEDVNPNPSGRRNMGFMHERVQIAARTGDRLVFDIVLY